MIFLDQITHDFFASISLPLSQSQELPTHKGLSFLQLKYELLLSYCTHACFYLLLKAEGKPVQNHPVVKQLVGSLWLLVCGAGAALLCCCAAAVCCAAPRVVLGCAVQSKER